MFLSSESFFRKIIHVLFIIGCGILFLTIPSAAVVNTGWQPVNITPWAQLDIPPGWSYGTITQDPKDPDQATLEAVAPNGETKLQYVFDKNLNPATAGELRRNQDTYMGSQGFCHCGGEPSFEEGADRTTMEQIYIKGTNEGAVVCSAAYPGWGRYQYALLMDGTSSVSEYFEDLPDTLAEHIRPITPVNATAS